MKTLYINLFTFFSLFFLSWSSPVLISNFGFNYDMSAAISDNGYAIIVWTNHENSNSMTEFSFFDGESWSLNEKISDQSIQILPNCGVDGKGNVLVAWVSLDENNDKSIVIKEKLLNQPWNEIFNSKINLSNYFLDLKTNINGQSVVTWVNRETHDIQVFSYTIGDTDYNLDTIVTTPNEKYCLSIEMDMYGNSLLTWIEDETMIVYSAHKLVNDSDWSKPEAVYFEGENFELKLNMNPNGNAVLCWYNFKDFKCMAAIYENQKWQTPVALTLDSVTQLNPKAFEDYYVISWLNINTGNIEALRNISNIWQKPVILSTTSEIQDNNTFDPTAFYLSWIDMSTGNVMLSEYPRDQNVIPSFILYEFNNDNPMTLTSNNLALCFWQTIIDSQYQIMTSVNQ